MTASPPRPSAPPAWTPSRALGAALVASVLLAAIEWAAGADATAVRVATSLAVYLVAAAGAWAAAWAYRRGDHLRRAWALFGLDYLALACGRLFLSHDLLGLPAGPLAGWLLAAATVLSNAFGVWGMVLFASTWRRTGLPLPSSGRRLATVVVPLAVASLLAVGPDLLEMGARAARGDVVALSYALGDACDVAVFLLVVPVFLTARALAGGTLAWPFGLISASCLAWLLLDGGTALTGLAGSPSGVAAASLALLRNLGCLLLAAAAVAQRLAIRLRPR
ncbi:MAG TPA: hypothetical protein VMU15_07250 [Anaeromyxobacter sp.]|nr:hypothetical protein [Anaeromyxobacter sp.]